MYIYVLALKEHKMVSLSDQKENSLEGIRPL